MIDPNYLEVFAQAIPSRAHGNHHKAAFQLREYVQFSRRRFKDPRTALRYGRRLVERWKRLHRALYAKGQPQ